MVHAMLIEQSMFYNNQCILLQVWGRTKKDYSYTHRSGALGDMPASGKLSYLPWFKFLYV